MVWLFSAVSHLASQSAAQTNCEAPPQLWSMPREQYVVDIVVAVAAKGLSELGVVVAVCGGPRAACGSAAGKRSPTRQS